MRRSRLGLIIGLVGALIAIGYGLYMLGAQRSAEPAAPDPYRYGFVLIALLAAGGGWMIDWNAALAAVLLAAAAVIALLAFGLSVRKKGMASIQPLYACCAISPCVSCVWFGQQRAGNDRRGQRQIDKQTSSD